MELTPTLSHLKSLFSTKNFQLPGFKAQLEMSVVGRERLIKSYSMDYRESAVMVLLYPDNDQETHLIFIIRNVYEGVHSGQIGLPGGAFETEDIDLTETAIRETAEEIGVKIMRENIVGKLTPLEIPVSGYIVHPYIGHSTEPIHLHLDESEVSDVIQIRLQDLLQLKPRVGNFKTSSGFSVSAPYFDLNGDRLWGATAMIIAEFRKLFP